MARSKRGRNLKNWKSNRADAGIGKLRIIGGKYRGRLIEYSGDPLTRPMKDNIREALFNLIGGWVEGKAVFDLFAGTGAIGLEALSRGASQVNFVERHFPTAKIVQQNIAALDASLNEIAEVHASDTFFWVRQFVTKSDLPTEPWMVFCCPPYDFYVERNEEVLVMLDAMLALAPADSLFIVESDDRFDASTLPAAPDSIQPEDDEKPIEWVVRQYAPAQVAILKLF